MRALVFDTETTGLIENRTVRKAMWPEIIEFAGIMIDWDTLEILDSYETLIKPSKRLDPKIVEITRITDEMLEGRPHFAEVADEIRSGIETCDLAIAHNCSFDVEMVDMEFERLGRKIRWPRTICTVEQTIAIKGARMKLGDLHEYLFGMRHEDAHRSMPDVRALVRVVQELKRRDLL